MRYVPLLQLCVVAAAFSAGAAHANHPVFVEGNCPSAPASGLVPPGTCGDYDGDGRIGVAEDNDGLDRVFGTIGAALGAAGVNQNGRVTIVTSGIFPEVVTINPTTGNVTLEAAPGVEANIDAVLQGNAGNVARQAQPGIIVNAADATRVTLRNLVSRNWTVGIAAMGTSHVTIEECRVENNLNYGIQATGSAKVKIDKSSATANGFRTDGGAAGSAPDGPANANPGGGIDFDDNSKGAVFRTNVSGNLAAGISGRNVVMRDNYLFDNGRGDDERDWGRGR